MPTTLIEPVQPQSSTDESPVGTRAARSTVGAVGRSLLQLAAEAKPARETPVDESEPANRREFPRRIGMCSARVGLCPNGVPAGGPQREWLLAGTPIFGELRDVTLKSAAFESNSDLPVGDRILLRLENREYRTRVDTVGEVLRTSKQDGRYLIVCRLQTDLRYEDISALGWVPFESDVV